MGASCYLCEKQSATWPETSPGDAVGVCKLCGVLACLGHGRLDPNDPAYECATCIANTLAAASVGQSPGASGGSSPPAGPRGPSGPPPAGPGGGASSRPPVPPGYAQRAVSVKKVEDVIDLSDESWASVRADIEYLSGALAGPHVPAELRASIGAANEQARSLMAAAVAIAMRLELPMSDLILPLQRVVDAMVLRPR